MSKKLRTLYLAGFDVFLPNPVEHGEKLKSIAGDHGLVGHFPLDNVIEAGRTPEETAKKIAFANIDLIKQSDAVIANANSFRGHEPDSGTMFEIGFAVALNKPVFVYMEDHRPMLEKVPNAHGVDDQGFSVEDFNLPVNLMIACTAKGIYRTYAEAVQAVVEYNKAIVSA